MVSTMRQDEASKGREGLQDGAQYGTGQHRTSTIQESGTRVTVYEAADALGVTVDAIRKRIQRGTIPHERHEDGRVYVLLDEATKLQDQNSYETSTEQGQVQDNGPVRYGTHEFVESLQDQIGFLRRELERKDAILLRMAERIPEIEATKATSEPPDAPERASEGSDKGNTTPKPPEPLERRSWLYRFFFGPS
jgi:hypothetical protein